MHSTPGQYTHFPSSLRKEQHIDHHIAALVDLLKRPESHLPYYNDVLRADFTMISDDDLYRLAIFLGSVAMVLIVVYHFFEVNSQEDSALAAKAAKATPVQQTPAVGKTLGATR
ncbi:Uu.00g072570.m01.CDS01 [Anthostomella pinea]|uniref:Dolichyl-diphosphooligosaccharide--protein glycosyltransferase subunit 4 n=1 Tax=Anthostomella pinea TaxID=933095 RepID=A0AAI8VV39_9PEZI|nr:Uu.00g072570.m01.CDS01 [Anthostomella pinea]